MNSPSNHYGRLVGKEVVAGDLSDDFVSEFDNPKRVLAQTEVGIFVSCFVSTVFLVINHGWGEKDLWFETMIFGPRWQGDEYQERYETYDEAMAGHEKAVRLAKRFRLWYEFKFWLGKLFKRKAS